MSTRAEALAAFIYNTLDNRDIGDGVIESYQQKRAVQAVPEDTLNEVMIDMNIDLTGLAQAILDIIPELQEGNPNE